MIILGLGLSLRLTQVLVPPVRGGATSEDSVFPRTAAMLADTRYQRALKLVFRSWNDKDLSRYRSLVDAFLCRCVHGASKYCFAYYHGNGLPLRDLATVEQLASADNLLATVLEVASALENRAWMEDLGLKRKRRPWREVRDTVLALVEGEEWLTPRRLSMTKKGR